MFNTVHIWVPVPSNRSSDTILPGAPVLSYLALTTSMPEVCTPVPFQQVMSSQTNITIFFSKVGGWERKRQGRSTVYQYLMISLPGIQLWPYLGHICLRDVQHISRGFVYSLDLLSCAWVGISTGWVQTSSCCGCFVATFGGLPDNIPNMWRV